MYCTNCGEKTNQDDKFCSSCGSENGTINTGKKVAPTLQTNSSVDIDFSKDIGKRIWVANNLTANYKGGSCLDVKEGPAAIIFHKNGLKISSGFFKSFEIPYSNIITVKYEDRDSLGNYKTKDKTVVGRAVGGALLLGPLGAVIGGISGIGSKSKKIDKETDYIIINYWDKITQNNEVLLFSGKHKRKGFNRFVSEFFKRKRQSNEIPEIAKSNNTTSTTSYQPIRYKNRLTALILSIFFGFWGLDRFYVGHIILGIIKLFTVGGFFIWWLIDIVLILKGEMKGLKGSAVKFT